MNQCTSTGADPGSISVRNSETENWVGVLPVFRQNLIAGFENLFKALGAQHLQLRLVRSCFILPEVSEKQYYPFLLSHMWRRVIETFSTFPERQKYFCMKYLKTHQDDVYGIHIKWECLDLVGILRKLKQTLRIFAPSLQAHIPECNMDCWLRSYPIRDVCVQTSSDGNHFSTFLANTANSSDKKEKIRFRILGRNLDKK